MRRAALNYLALTGMLLGSAWGFVYGGKVGGVICTALAVISFVAWRRGRARRQDERSIGLLSLFAAVFGLRAMVRDASEEAATQIGGSLFGEMLVPYVASGIVSAAVPLLLGLDNAIVAAVAAVLGVGTLAGVQLGAVRAGTGALGNLVRHARDTGGLGLVEDPVRRQELVKRSAAVAAGYLVLALLAALSLPDDDVANPLWSMFILLTILLLPVLTARNYLFLRASGREREATLTLMGFAAEVVVAILLYAGISAEGGEEFSAFVDAVLSYLAGALLNPVRWHTAGKRGSANALWAT